MKHNSYGDVYPFAITFIDPLFAIALHLGFSHGLFQEQWFRQWQVPSREEAFHIGIFALGFCVIALAWLGYHRSISRRPLRGLARFAIDVILVMVYATVLMKFNEFGAVLCLLAVVYFLYLLWDLSKILEYRREYAGAEFSEKYDGVFVDCLWFSIFIFLTICHYKRWGSDGFILIGAFCACFGHRVNKVRSIWRSLAEEVAGLLFSSRKNEPSSNMPQE